HPVRRLHPAAARSTTSHCPPPAPPSSPAHSVPSLARPLLPGPPPRQRPNRHSRHRQIIRRRPLLTVVRVRLPNRRRDPMLHPFPPPPVTPPPPPPPNFLTA